jgi:predicted phage terminase large subunit-like protein
MKIDKREMQAILRNDFVAFVQRGFYDLNPEVSFQHNWHIEAIAEQLEKCRTGKLRRLIINVPPRSLKSHMASISFPAWLLGHNPSAQIICVSYAQDLSDKLAGDCRSLMAAPWYREAFRWTRLAARKQAVHDFGTTKKGCRMATSIGGAILGRGADTIIIDDPLKPDEAVSETQRTAVNNWYYSSLISRLNTKSDGCVILVMQRLHEDDLVGHLLAQSADWHVLKFPAIAEEDETHLIQTPYRPKTIKRKAGEALHPARESLKTLAEIREVQGEYNFASQYGQRPAPLGGGMVKSSWFKVYSPEELPKEFELILQSLDSANKTSELSDYSVCTTWGLYDNHIYLLDVRRSRMEYPELRRAVKEQALLYKAQVVLIEDKASGTQLIQDLVADGVHSVTRYEPKMDKVMRMHSVTSTIENGFVHIPVQAPWLAEFLHELSIFPNGRFDDQVDSVSQALDWIRNESMNQTFGVFEYEQEEARKVTTRLNLSKIPESIPCPKCGRIMNQPIPGGLRCAQCGEQWARSGAVSVRSFSRGEVLRGAAFR